MSKWRPIETAPDYRGDLDQRIIVYAEHWKKQVDVVLADGDWWRVKIANGEMCPTHWMPLPSPPPAKGLSMAKNKYKTGDFKVTG